MKHLGTILLFMALCIWALVMTFGPVVLMLITHNVWWLVCYLFYIAAVVVLAIMYVGAEEYPEDVL